MTDAGSDGPGTDITRCEYDVSKTPDVGYKPCGRPAITRWSWLPSDDRVIDTCRIHTNVVHAAIDERGNLDQYHWEAL